MVSEDAKKQNMSRLQLSHIRGIFTQGVKRDLRRMFSTTLYRKTEQKMTLIKFRLRNRAIFHPLTPPCSPYSMR
jgi:hypothetical protein